MQWVPEAEAWLIRSHEAIRFVLRNDDRVFRLAHSEAAPRAEIAELRGGHRSHRLVRGDEHDRLHRWYMRWFIPSEVERYRSEKIVPLVNAIVDRFAADASVELCTRLCQALGPRVIATILGLPVDIGDDRFYDRSQRAADAVLAWNSRPEDGATLAAGIRESRDLNEMLLPTVRARAAEPRDDLISRMWREGPTVMGSWSEQDTLVATREMLLGASGTTREALANALYELLTDANARRDAFRDTQSLENFVEESLRLHDSRTLVGLPRIADQDVEVAGTTVTKDQLVVLLSDAGGRDTSHYADPDTIDLARRAPKDHFAFSAGARACIGANLARVQIRTALEALFTRFPHIVLDESAQPPVRTGIGSGFGMSCYGPLYIRPRP